MSKGLSFVAAVNEQVKSGAVTEEDGKILSHRVLQQVNVLASIGVSLPQDEIVISLDQKQSLREARDMRLLGDGKPSVADEGQS